MPVALRHPGHHDQQFCDDAVGRPQLHAVQFVGRSAVDRCRRRGQPRRVGAHIRLGEQKRRYRPRGTPRQELLLLLVIPGELERLRHTDRLMRGQQRPEAGMHTRHHHQRPVVRDLRQIQSAVLRRDLHSEATQFGKALHVLVGDLRVALDDAAVDGVEEFPQPGQELLGPSGLGFGGLGKGWMSSSGKRPRNNSLAREGLSQPLSRDSSATALACSSLTCACCAIGLPSLEPTPWGASVRVFPAARRDTRV